ncbi:related to MET1 - siroheme synthase [Pseudozyma flocculosa]|uniref:precorrin-2 dehydrogenase n=2 Tax=Pseudozyma flocculosa TaxID=84751 RepID=A0A5C3F8M2_9BASI|nr:related to MET1 - siroheme synthase [Pseudozyma flocculosa]
MPTNPTSHASDPSPFPPPVSTASLLLSHRPPTGKVAIVLGTGKLAASRCFACLEAGIRPVVVSVQDDAADAQDPLASGDVCPEIRYRVQQNMVTFKTIRYQSASAAMSTSTSTSTTTTQAEAIRRSWEQLLDELDEGEANSIFIVCITDTLHSGDAAKRTPVEGHVADAAAADVAASTAYDRAAIITKLCRRRRIPINVADKPDLCDFSFPACHRFPCIDGAVPSSSPLQIAVTTNGRGCRLAGRIRRELVSALPRNVGDAVEKVGRMRDMAKQEDQDQSAQGEAAEASSSKARRAKKPRERTASGAYKDVEEEDLSFDTTPLNSPVPQLTPKNPMDKAGISLKAALGASAAKHAASERQREEAIERTKRRMRWVAQISEYWPIEYLGGLKEEQMKGVLSTYAGEQPAAGAPKAQPGDVAQSSNDGDAPASQADEDRTERGRATSRAPSPERQARARSQHSLVIRPPAPVRQKKGHIYLLGSGTGHPGLLTVLAHRLLSSPDTHLILSDKLVPASILRLIPSSTPLEIAKKFPGNAEGAQSELIAMALKAAIEEGKTVVRLKQGDPFVYGRGGEEVLAFRRAGIECTVVPGISSALAAPLMLGIPVTQRGAADSLVLCTGVGRGGKKVRLPGYERGRTLIVLMGVARLKAVVQTLTGNSLLGHTAAAAVSAAAAAAGEEDSIGDRDGPAFPPHTPIAIIERASSSDQRMVASTLAGIADALERSGEQRPPGMMVIGWAVLSLAGEGDVRISDDAAECTVSDDSPWTTDAEAQQELKRRDQARVDRWLGAKGYIVREGLDEAYRASMEGLLSSVRPNGDAGAAPAATTAATPADATQIGWTTRDSAGWAGRRYVDGKPEGGWAPGEAPNRPARDEAEYAQHQEYVEIRARLAKMDGRE